VDRTEELKIIECEIYIDFYSGIGGFGLNLKRAGHKSIISKQECRNYNISYATAAVAMGLLTQVDMAAFAGYCQAYARWKEAEEFISKHGSILKTSSGYTQQIPQVSIAQQNLKQMRNFCSELGLTPSARSRLNITNAGGTIEGDEMEALLGRCSQGRRCHAG